MNTSIRESLALAKNQNNDFNQQENINMKEQQRVPKDTVALPSGEQVKMSNHMGDQVKTVCQICLEQFSINKMHVHIRLVHNKSPMEYKEQFGNHIKNICDKVFHKCAVCSQILLWEFNKIKDHMYKHKVTHGQYNKQFNIVPCKKGFNPKTKHYSNKPSKTEELKNRLPQEHDLTVENNDRKPFLKENPTLDEENRRQPSRETADNKDGYPLLTREETNIDFDEVKLEEAGIDDNLLQNVTLKKEHDTDHEDSELEEGEIPKRAYFETSLEDKLTIATVGDKINLFPDITAEELKKNIASLTKKVDGPAYKCNVCDKIIKDKYQMSCHVETHIKGISYPCYLCGKVSNTRTSLRVHTSRYHTNI